MAINVDVLVWGSSWGSIDAALAAAETGVSVILVSNWTRLGDPMNNGLGRVDFGRNGTKVIGSWFNAEFFNRLARYLGTDYPQRTAPPTMCERVWKEMLDLRGVETKLGLTISSYSKTGDLGNSITMSDGVTINFRRGVDMDEDGRFARQFLTMGKGRESQLETGESLAGFWPVPSSFKPMNIRNPDGSLIRGISPYPDMQKGDADGGVQGYGWRLPVTQAGPYGKWVKPAGYDPALITFLKRSNNISSDGFRPLTPRGGFTAQGKQDSNSVVEVPLQWDFPLGTQAEQDAIQLQMYNTWATWMYAAAFDTDFSLGCRQFMSTIGLCLDELDFTGSTRPNWPKQVYRRSTLRMLNPYYKMLQKDAQTDITKPDSLALGTYSFDCKPVQYLAYSVDGVEGYIQDSFGSDPAQAKNRQTKIYQAPRRMFLSPDCRNVASGNCAGMSFVISTSWRIDYGKSAAGSSLGALAGLSCLANGGAGVDMIDYPYPDLAAYLTARGQVLSYP